MGLSHSLFGTRLLPIGTVYDPFIERGLDALNYACYQDARFLLVATPSGLTLAPEGGAHQSISTPLIGLTQHGLTTFEPAFADELAAMMRWSFEHLQRDAPDTLEGDLLNDAAGGSVYLRLSTRKIPQTKREMNAITHTGTCSPVDTGFTRQPRAPSLPSSTRGRWSPKRWKLTHGFQENNQVAGCWLSLRLIDYIEVGKQRSVEMDQANGSSLRSKLCSHRWRVMRVW